MSETVKLVRGNAAIDAVILTKDRAADGVVRYFDYTLDRIAFIGDEVQDLPLLMKKGLGFVGAPANAQQRVIDAVRELSYGYISSHPVFDGFLDFYQKAATQGVSLVISDKDGVLKDGGDSRWGPAFMELALQMGTVDTPYITVLTGSSYNQNLSFMQAYCLDSRLGQNPKVRDYPYLLLVENGAVHVNVLTGETRNYVSDINPELLDILKTEFEERVREKLESDVLPRMGLIWTDEYEDQQGKVYHVKDKQSMVSFNVPRAFLNGKPYRKSEESDTFRDAVIEVMAATAESLKLPYERL